MGATMTAIGFLLIVLGFTMFPVDKPNTVTHAATTICLVGGVIFLIGGIFRWLWAVMP